MFGKLYLGEIKKILRPKSLIALAVAIVLFFIIATIAYNVQVTLNLGTDGDAEVTGTVFEILGGGYDLSSTPEQVDQSIIEATENYDEAAVFDKSHKTNQRYAARAILTALRYQKAHGLYKSFTVATSGMLGGKSAEGFTSVLISMLGMVLLVYGIVLAAGLYADEYKNGTIKLVSLRPVSKNQLTTAKFLAGLTILVGIFLLCVFIAFLYGCAAYGSNSSSVVYMVFNSKSVIKSSVGGVAFLEIVSAAMQVGSLYTLAFALSTITRKKTAAIVLSLLVWLGLAASLLGMISPYIPPFLFSPNMSISEFFLLGSNYSVLASFWLTLPMFVFYNGGLIAAMYLVVNKKDVY